MKSFYYIGRNEKILLKKHREIISYLIVGIATTIVYFLVRFGVYAVIPNGTTSVVIAQIAAILFAFVANKMVVFRNKAGSFKQLLRQFFDFCLGRGVVFVLDVVVTYLAVDTYSQFFIQLFRLDTLQYGTGLLGLPFIKEFIGSPEVFNSFIFAMVNQVLAIILNYVISKYWVFKDKKVVL